ncbi:hypothetical protein [Candidatus Bartonella washoeensis]|uniref:hypothetical protein n=1 Tax=Candidatus Bartonella washoeensis TaxID=186739 RepID=UPI003CC807AF
MHDWKIKDHEAIKFLTDTGLKAGILCQIAKTIMLAHMAACGNCSKLMLKHTQRCIKNRNVEELA